MSIQQYRREFFATLITIVLYIVSGACVPGFFLLVRWYSFVGANETVAFWLTIAMHIAAAFAAFGLIEYLYEKWTAEAKRQADMHLRASGMR